MIQGSGIHAFKLTKVSKTLHIQRFTSKQTMENFLYNNVYWLLAHSVVLTGLVITAYTTPEVFDHHFLGIGGFLGIGTLCSEGWKFRAPQI